MTHPNHAVCMYVSMYVCMYIIIYIYHPIVPPSLLVESHVCWQIPSFSELSPNNNSGKPYSFSTHIPLIGKLSPHMVIQCGPPVYDSVQLLHITPISLWFMMVYDTQKTIVFRFINQLTGGAHNPGVRLGRGFLRGQTQCGFAELGQRSRFLRWRSPVQRSKRSYRTVVGI